MFLRRFKLVAYFLIKTLNNRPYIIHFIPNYINRLSVDSPLMMCSGNASESLGFYRYKLLTLRSSFSNIFPLKHITIGHIASKHNCWTKQVKSRKNFSQHTRPVPYHVYIKNISKLKTILIHKPSLIISGS